MSFSPCFFSVYVTRACAGAFTCYSHIFLYTMFFSITGSIAAPAKRSNLSEIINLTLWLLLRSLRPGLWAYPRQPPSCLQTFYPTAQEQQWGLLVRSGIQNSDTNLAYMHMYTHFSWHHKRYSQTITRTGIFRLMYPSPKTSLLWRRSRWWSSSLPPTGRWIRKWAPLYTIPRLWCNVAPPPPREPFTFATVCLASSPLEDADCGIGLQTRSQAP